MMLTIQIDNNDCRNKDNDDGGKQMMMVNKMLIMMAMMLVTDMKMIKRFTLYFFARKLVGWGSVPQRCCSAR